MISFGLFHPALAAQVSQIVLAKVLDGIENRFGSGHAERALAIVEQVGEPGQRAQVAFLTMAGKDAGQGIHHDPRAALAGGAFGATVLLLDSLHVLGGHGYDVDVPVEDDQAVPAHEGSDLAFIEIILRQLENRSFRFSALPIVDHLAAPAGKNDFSQVEPPIQVRFQHIEPQQKKRLSAYL